jgi:hypothetical protein
VQSLLSGDPTRLRAFVEESPLRADKSDLDFLVVVCDHDAWFIEGQGWHDANAPVTPGGVVRFQHIWGRDPQHAKAGVAGRPRLNYRSSTVRGTDRGFLSAELILDGHGNCHYGEH